MITSEKVGGTDEHKKILEETFFNMIKKKGSS